MSLSAVVIIAATVYLLLLFALAYVTERRANSSWIKSPIIYTLSIAIFCTSWTFYGSVGRAATSGISFFAVYFGPILMFVFGYPLLTKIMSLCRQHHITSIADFISARYGGSRALSALVTAIAVFGIIPYIALQLRGIAISYELIEQYSQSADSQSIQLVPRQTELITAIVMTLFAILFGTRHIDVTERHAGVVGAVAFESLIKLFAFLAVGAFISFGLFHGVADIFQQASQQFSVTQLLNLDHALLSADWWLLTLLSFMAIICLPRQFHIMMIENNEQSAIKQARWQFPLYLILINLFVIPIAVGGKLLLSGSNISPDTYVLALPITEQAPLLTALVFIGGLSAATGMVIVACITLATMISNEIIMPLVLKRRLTGQKTEIQNFIPIIKLTRRVSIFAILTLAYLFTLLIGDSYMLVSIGLISFVAVAQFFPSIALGLTSIKISAMATYTGLLLGFIFWGYTVFLPAMIDSGWLANDILIYGPFNISWLKPTMLFGVDNLSVISHGTFWSLLVNVATVLIISHLFPATQTAQQDAKQFLSNKCIQIQDINTIAKMTVIPISELKKFAQQFVDDQKVSQLFNYHLSHYYPEQTFEQAPESLQTLTEKVLAGAIGTASAQVLMSSLNSRYQQETEQVQQILAQATDAITSNFDLLQNAMESIEQGVIIVDQSLTLQLWNHRFCQLYQIPDNTLRKNITINALLRYGQRFGQLPHVHVKQMRTKLKYGKRFTMEQQINHNYLHIHGNSMPDGGFVITYTDISEQKQTELTIRNINDSLEQRVEHRTVELTKINQQLSATLTELKQTQEQLVETEKMASLGQLVAGMAHEINTPVGVAITASTFLADQLADLTNQLEENKLSKAMLTCFIENFDHSIVCAIDNLKRTANLVSYFKQLSMEQFIEEKRQFNFYQHIENIIISLEDLFAQHTVDLRIKGDQQLTCFSFPGVWTQIITGLLSNAVRHGFSHQASETAAKIIINFSIDDNFFTISLEDNGVGIDTEQQQQIFEPFFTTSRSKGDIGLGLHLIFNLVSQSLKSQITCDSAPNHGAKFTIQVPVSEVTH